MNKPTLAVIGSGIAGLSAAWLLKDKYQVTLFEKHAQPGMGAYAVDVGDDSTPVNIDIPLRIITSGYYRELYQLYNTVGVAIERTDHAGAFFKDSGEQVFHYRNYHFGNKSYSFLNGPNRFTRTNISHGYEATEFLWRLSRFVLADLEQLTFGEFIRRAGYQHSSFVKLVLMPMLSTICTCDYDSIYQYPANIIVDYLTCGVTKEGVWKATYGVKDIVARLTQGYEVHTGHAINAITESSTVASNPALMLTLDNGQQRTFDQVVIATQPQHAAQMVSSIAPDISTQLSSIPFEQSEMVVHRDQSIYPQSWKKLSPVYYSVDPKAQRPMATVCLNKSMPSVKECRPVFQTWHPTVELNPKQVLARAVFERPLVTFDTLDTLAQIKQTMARPENRLWYCGSYLGGGIPLLEAGVRSSLAVANQLGVTAPWQPEGASTA